MFQKCCLYLSDILTRKCKFILAVESGKFNWRGNKQFSSCVVSISVDRRGAVAYFISKVFQNLTVKIIFGTTLSFFNPAFEVR